MKLHQSRFIKVGGNKSPQKGLFKLKSCTVWACKPTCTSCSNIMYCMVVLAEMSHEIRRSQSHLPATPKSLLIL